MIIHSDIDTDIDNDPDTDNDNDIANDIDIDNDIDNDNDNGNDIANDNDIDIYYIHFEITGDPCNLIGSQQCDLFPNRTIFCSKSHLFQIASFMF